MPRTAKAETATQADGAAVWQDGGLTIAEAVRFAGVGRSTLYGAMEEGRLAYTKVGRRRVVARRGLVELLASGAQR